MFRRLRNAWHLYRFAARDARTPLAAKALPWLSVLYLLWPMDIIPDLIPVLGQLDDLTAIVALCMFALRMIPDSVRKDHKRK